MDTDVSHAVEERLQAIEVRLDDLESGKPGKPKDEEEVEEVETSENIYAVPEGSE